MKFSTNPISANETISQQFEYAFNTSNGLRAHINVPDHLRKLFRQGLRSICCIMKDDGKIKSAEVLDEEESDATQEAILCIAKQINEGKAEIYKQSPEIEFIRIHGALYQLHLKEPFDMKIMQDALPGYKIIEDKSDNLKVNKESPKCFFIAGFEDEGANEANMQKIKTIIENIKA